LFYVGSYCYYKPLPPPYIKSKGPCSLHSLAFGSQIQLNIKKFPAKKIIAQGSHKIMNYPEGTIRTNAKGFKYTKIWGFVVEY
jgi:hypothetical protein